MKFSAKSPQTHWPLREIALLLLLTVGAFFLIFHEMDPYDNRILENVTIGGLDVGGMTKQEARTALKTALAETLYSQDLTVTLPEEKLILSPGKVKPSVNIRKAVDTAYRIGRGDGQTASDIPLLPYLDVKESYIRQLLADYAAAYDTELTQYSWELQGDMPELSTENFDPTVPTQTLVLTKGTPALSLDTQQAYEEILAAYERCITGPFTASPEVTPEAVPQRLDVEEIWLEHSIAPVDDSLSFVTYQPVSGSYGYSFNLRSAEYKLTRADWGETVSVPMEYEEPEILGDEVYFRDVLGQCDSPHTTTVDRNINLQRVCEILDGHILQPGEEFSFNEVIGERTLERGFRPGLTYSGTRIVKTIGGGVCQGSSTLHVCVLYADLEVTERVSHGFVVAYVPIGQDAAVSWSTSTDFKFRNNTNFPIKISAEMADGFMKMKILGTDEKDYYIELKSTKGEDSALIYSNCYKLKYDKETNELISKEFSTRSTYMHR